MLLLWKVAQISCQLLLRHFYGLQAVKSHCTGRTQGGTWGTCVVPVCSQPGRSLADAGDALWGVRPEGEAAAPSSCCKIQGQPGVRSLIYSPSKPNTTAGSTSPQEADISFPWSSSTDRAMKLPLWSLSCHRILPSASLLFSHKKRKAENRAALLSSFALPSKESTGLFFLPVVLFVSPNISNQIQVLVWMDLEGKMILSFNIL